MREYFPPKEVIKSLEYEPIVKQLVLYLPNTLQIMEILHGLKPNEPPVTWLKPVGKYFYVAVVVFSVIPSIALYFCIKKQREFYSSHFMNKEIS